jgi:hypothetical protein
VARGWLALAYILYFMAEGIRNHSFFDEKVHSQFLVFVDRHRFDADADPDPTFHFDADQNPDSDPTLKQSQVNTVVDQFQVYII